MEKTTSLKHPFLLIISFLVLHLAHATEDGKIEKLSAQQSLLQNELNKYYDIQKNGGWKKITGTKKFYQKGESSETVVQLKQRLKASGHYTSDDLSPSFNDELAAAVKKAQRQFGLKPTGVVDASLIKMLNVPVEQRIEQLMVNMERFRTLPTSNGTRLLANIPEFKLHVYEGDRHVFDMNIVVGKESTKTVIFNDEMTQIVFSPSWHVPPSIVRNEILPAINRNRDYLWRNRYVQTGTENGLPVIKQLPGAKNALGKVKFLFPNSHNIYFHDTPAKSLFELQKRAFSHGCIRLGEPEKLAQYLLRNHPSWDPAKIRKAMDSGNEQFVKLPQPVAVSISYFTSWVDTDGIVHFREDIYGHDRDMSRKIARGN